MNTRLFIVPIILTLLLIVGVAGTVLAYKELTRIQTASVQISEEIAHQTAQEERTARVRSRLEQLGHDEELIQSHLVAVDDVVPFLQHIEGVGSDNGALLEVVSVSNTASEGYVRISIKVNGTFSAVMRTLGALEYDSYAISINSISIDKRDVDMWEAVGNVTALIYLP